MQNCHSCSSTGGCPMAFGRRKFLAGMAAGASALAMQSGLWNFASAMAGEPASRSASPGSGRCSCYPKDHEKYWMSWPGHTYDVPGSQALYIKTLTEAAARLGVQLDVQQPSRWRTRRASPLCWTGSSKTTATGSIVTLMHMNWWGHVNQFVKNKGDLPAVVFVPLGMTFTGHLKETAHGPQDLRGLHARRPMASPCRADVPHAWVMKNTRLCWIHGAEDPRRDACPRWAPPAPHSAGALGRGGGQDGSHRRSAGHRRLLHQGGREDRQPKPAGRLNAAKNYLTAKRIMAVENCQTISLDCLRLVRVDRIPCPPCIAWSRLARRGRRGHLRGGQDGGHLATA